jgi:hypothetical protein
VLVSGLLCVVFVTIQELRQQQFSLFAIGCKKMDRISAATGTRIATLGTYRPAFLLQTKLVPLHPVPVQLFNELLVAMGR